MFVSLFPHHAKSTERILITFFIVFVMDQHKALFYTTKINGFCSITGDTAARSNCTIF